MFVGSGIHPKAHVLRDLVAAFHRDTIREINSGDIVRCHNAFAEYSLINLLFATGHRPVRDPFCYRRDINVDAGIAIVSDKVVSERHANRFSWLPASACEQVRQYLLHLERLSALAKGCVSDSILGCEIDKILSLIDYDNDLELPLFFLIADTRNKTLGFGEARLARTLSKYFPFPANLPRHVIATEGRNRGVPAAMIGSVLGHFDGLSHHLGVGSGLSPAEIGDVIRPMLQSILEAQGWILIPAPPLPQGPIGLSVRPGRRLHEVAMLGPESRRVVRENAWQEDKNRVRAALLSMDLTKKRIEKQAVIAARNALLADSSSDPGRINRRIVLFWRYMALLRVRGFRIDLPGRILAFRREYVEVPPDFTTQYGHAEMLRHRLVQHLDRMSRSKQKIRPSVRMAELLLSAILFGGLPVNAWKDFGRALQSAFHIEGFPFIELSRSTDLLEPPDWRWVPDALTAALLEGYRAATRNSSGVPVDETELQTALCELLIRFNIGSSSKEATDILKNAAIAYWTYHLPGFLRCYFDGTASMTSLPRGALLRLMTGQRLTGMHKQHAQDPDANRIESLGLWPTNANRGLDNRVSGNDFLKRLNEILEPREGKDTVEKDKRAQRSSRKKRAFINSLKLYAHEKPNLTPIASLICGWALHLATRGTKHLANLRYGTINQYIRVVAKPLVNNVSNVDFVNLADLEYEERYVQILLLFKKKRRPYVYGRIREFHDYLADMFACDDPDWKDVAARADVPAVEERVQANVLTDFEYQRSFSLLYFDQRETRRDRVQNAALLLLGYRFGLRIGEAVRLRTVDMQASPTFGLAVVQVTNNIFGETKSEAGVRQIPLLNALTEIEQDVLRIVLSTSEYTFNEDSRAAVFQEVAGVNRLIDRQKSVKRIHAVLRQVTGDPTFRYHHLRRSWCGQTCLGLFSDRLPAAGSHERLRSAMGVDNQRASELREFLTGNDRIGQKTMRALSVMAGHSSPEVTLTNYIHLPELLLSGWIARQQQIEECSDHLLGYVFNRTNATIRQQRYRKKIPPNESSAIRHLINIDAAFLPAESVTCEHPDTESLALVNHDDSSVVRMQQIDRILLLATVRSASISRIADSLLILESQVNLVLGNWRQIANDHGIDIFGCDRTSGDLWVPFENDASERIDSLLKETAGVRGLLTKWERTVAGLPDKARATLIEALVSWRHAFRPASSFLVFESKSQLRIFLSGMQVLSFMPTHFVAYIPKNTPSAALEQQREALEAMAISSIQLRHIPLNRGSTTKSKESRVGLGLIKSRKGPCSYLRRLNRALLVLSLHLMMSDRATIKSPS